MPNLTYERNDNDERVLLFFSIDLYNVVGNVRRGFFLSFFQFTIFRRRTTNKKIPTYAWQKKNI
jgi:hypothetical protein